MKKVLHLSIIAVVLMNAFAAQAAERADLKKKTVYLKHNGTERVYPKPEFSYLVPPRMELMKPSTARPIDPLDYHQAVIADHNKASELQKDLAAE